jgi:hypothetical protein
MSQIDLTGKWVFCLATIDDSHEVPEWSGEIIGMVGDLHCFARQVMPPSPVPIKRVVALDEIATVGYVFHSEMELNTWMAWAFPPDKPPLLKVVSLKDRKK